MTRPRVPVRGTEATQVAEYLRSFLCSRIAWSRMNGLLIISGAFGVFRRDLFRAAGGLSRDTLGEDMELVMRLHEQLRPMRPGVRIEFAADATSWTEAPSGLRPLRGQRIRWHTGLLDNLRLHRRMVGRPAFGAVGLLSLPYTILVEVLGPILQVVGYVTVIVLALYGLIAWEYAIVFLVLALLVAQLQTAGAILTEEIGFGRYRRRDLLLIGGWGLLEMFWYQPLSALWRFWATFLWLIGRRPGWGRSRAARPSLSRPPRNRPSSRRRRSRASATGGSRPASRAGPGSAASAGRSRARAGNRSRRRSRSRPRRGSRAGRRRSSRAAGASGALTARARSSRTRRSRSRSARR